MGSTVYTSLQNLYETIDSNIKDGAIDLVPTIFDLGPIGIFYKEIIDGSAFSITGASLDPDSWASDLTSFLLTGSTDSLGFNNMDVTIEFSDSDTGISSLLKATATGQEWAIAGIDWFSLSDPFLGVSIDEKSAPVYGLAGGNVKVSDIVDLKLQMAYPIQNNTWVFQGDFEEPYPSISNFYQLIGGVNLSASLPQPFSTLTDLGLKHIDLSYNSENVTVDSIGLTISTSSDYQWELIPGKLFVNGIEISSLITSPSNAADRTVGFTITGTFTIGPVDSNVMQVIATAPNFAASIILQEGTIQLGDLFTLFLPGVTLDLSSEITKFNMVIDPTSQVYSLTTEVKSDWTFLSIPNPKLDFTMTGMALEIASEQAVTAGKFSGLFNIGADEATGAEGVDITVFAAYSDETWTFGGNTGEGQSISLIDIAVTFLKPFGIGEIPTWVSNGGLVLNLSDLSFLATIPDSSTGKSNSYQVGGTVEWELNYRSFDLKLDATVDVTFQDGDASGEVIGSTELFGLEFNLGYKFNEAEKEKEIYLNWEGITATYEGRTKEDVFTVKFEKMSLGGIITKLMQAAIPSFELAAPWSLLNSINLDGLSFVYTKNLTDSAKNTIVITYEHTVDLGFMSITKITLTKDAEGVHLGFEGTFLGLEIKIGDDTTEKLAGKGSKVDEMPGVPGMGDKLFDLEFLGMGQHLSLAGSAGFESVDEAIDVMKQEFNDTNSDPNAIPIKADATGLVFDQNSDWLIGADFTVAQFYRMAFVFNDPNLYGLVIGVSDKAEFLKNLQFEILYKKINESIGVYQLELQLPDAFRQLEFGAVSITLPNIGIKIYTNGNFYLDIGWPASITDFSRSFTLQMFPFIGSGGFYFASLTGATASGLPPVQKGVFNPVIEAGIAVSLGVGKTIDKGILKAGLSLTAIGIFQGTYAPFSPNPNLPNGLSDETDTYYKFSGTLALVGKIYGEVNFAIISASFDITAYIQVTFVVEAYKAIPISFEAGVSVSLSVKINLGLFKITIHLSFSTTISASFTIGTDTTEESLWYKVDHTDNALLMSSMYYQAAADTVIKWQPIVNDTDETFGLDLYFIPHLTVSGETIGTIKPGPQYVGMLYLDTGDTNPGDFTQFGMNALATGALYWVANAIVGSGQGETKLSWIKTQDISVDQITEMLCYMETRPNNEAPFNYKNTSGNDIESFLKAFFTVQISAVDPTNSDTISAAVFPVFPELQMQTETNKVEGDLVDFATKSMTGTKEQDYIGKVSKLLKKINMSYESAATADHYASTDCENVKDENYMDQPDLSMPTFIFTDFMALVVKQLLQNALDYMNANGKTSETMSTLITAVITTENMGQLSGMASRFMMYGLRLPVPPTVSDEESEALYALSYEEWVAADKDTEPLSVLTGQQWTVADTLTVADDYQVNLMNSNASWITFMNPVDGKLEVLIDADDIQRTINLRTNVLNPSVKSAAAISNVNYTPQNFSLGGNTEWDYPDFFDGLSNKPTLWKTPSNFRAELLANKNNALEFSLKTLTPNGDTAVQGEIETLKWATSINVNVQKITAQDLLTTPLAGNIYELVGADDASINMLEDLLTYKNKEKGGSGAFIEQIQFLMAPDPATGESNFVSAKNGDLSAAIIQANLSTETNPGAAIVSFMSFGETVEPEYNTLNDPGDFATLLWECSVVRSGGFYFYYITPADEKGLPDYLFNESGIANIQMLITYADFIPKPFVNAVITGDDIDFSKTSVYAQSEDITVLVPTLAAGNVGYELVRNNPGDFNPVNNPPLPAQDQIYLQNQFNLLGVSLPAVAAYQNYLPAGPTDEMTPEEIQLAKAGSAVAKDPSGPWNYRAAIPFYKFMQGASDDPNYLNPYAGIGADVAMTLNWQDMFGNTPPSNVNTLPISMKNLYTDTILSVSQWPSISCFYLFDLEAGHPELIVNFCFDVSRYNDGTAGAFNNATVDLATYINLNYQLGTDDMTMDITSTIEGTNNETPEGYKQTIDTATLDSSFITPIINYLKAIVGGNSNPDSTAIPIPYPVSGQVTKAKIADYQDSIALLVNINMNRTENVDPAFEGAKGVASAITPVKPQAQSFACGTSEKSTLSLSYFADLFEKTFTDQPTEGILIKIATASDVENTTDASGAASKQVWMVRFDSTGDHGIKYTYDKSNIFFFSPIPLARSLSSVTTKINTYQTGQQYPFGGSTAGVKKSFSGIDLDNWGKQFLEAVDSFLAPGLAVPAFLLDNGELIKEILDSKDKLADAIEGTIDYIIEPADKSAAQIENAQEKWKQEILKELSATYKFSAAIQTPVKIDSSWNDSNIDPYKEISTTPKLYGNMVGSDPTIPDEGDTAQSSTEYSLSTSKLPMGEGDSWLTYMFESKDTSEFRSFKFGNMLFKVSHLEQGIHAIDGIEGYSASTWLTFIIPLDASLSEAGEDIIIPVPLRAFPTPPSVTAQQAIYPAISPIVTMQDARDWSFSYTYKNAIAAQDTIETQVEFNIPAAQKNSGADTDVDDATITALDAALAQFISVYDQINTDFTKYLAKLTQKDVLDQTTVFTNASYAVQAFNTIINQVAVAWKTCNQVNPRPRPAITPSSFMFSEQKPIKLNYTIIETGDSGNLNVQVIASATNQLPQIPIINIPGYTREDKAGNNYEYYKLSNQGTKIYLSYDGRNAEPLRESVINDLDILNIQNAWGGAQIVRNKDLLQNDSGGWQTTNEHFLYQTPLVKFYAKMITLLSDGTSINIAAISTDQNPAPPNRSITDNMLALFESFTAGVDTDSLHIKLSLDYTYSIENTDFPVTVPVLLATPFDLSTTDEGASFANSLSQTMSAWLSTNIPGTPNGIFKFEMDVFSSFDANTLIFQLPLHLNLLLPA